MTAHGGPLCLDLESSSDTTKQKNNTTKETQRQHIQKQTNPKIIFQKQISNTSNAHSQPKQPQKPVLLLSSTGYLFFSWKATCSVHRSGFSPTEGMVLHHQKATVRSPYTKHPKRDAYTRTPQVVGAFKLFLSSKFYCVQGKGDGNKKSDVAPRENLRHQKSQSYTPRGTNYPHRKVKVKVGVCCQKQPHQMDILGALKT